MKNDNEQKQTPKKSETSWGPKLFYLTLAASLVFFWWLLIYSHGISPLPH